MGKVVALTTGGTIASVASAQDGLYSSGKLTGSQLLGMQDLGLTCPVDIASVFQLPSNHLTFELLLTLRDRVAEALADPEVDGVAITHGTDTLEESCYFLDLTLDSDKPVVMTGSQRVPSELGTDSFVNIRQAVLAAASPQTRGLGVLVLFNERLYTARRVRKMHAFNPQAFTSFGYGYVGYVDKSDVAVYQKPVRGCRESHATHILLRVVTAGGPYLRPEARQIRRTLRITHARDAIIGHARSHESHRPAGGDLTRRGTACHRLLSRGVVRADQLADRSQPLRTQSAIRPHRGFRRSAG